MGGFGSGRWGWHRPQATTDGLLFLDVRKLARDGCLRPGWWPISWHRGTESLGRIMLVVSGEHPDSVVLDYAIQAGDGPWQPIRERVTLARSPP